MRRAYAGGLALLLALPLTAVAQEPVSQNEHLNTVRNLQDTRQRLYALQAELSDAHLQQTAMLISLATQGKARLLLGSGMIAAPKFGRIPIREGQGNAPFLTYYPISERQSVVLGEAGTYEIQGAVRISVGARTSQQNRCEAGSYLLALKTAANGEPSLALLDAQADENGQVRYHEALRLPTERVPGALFKTQVEFSGPQDVSQQHPAWQMHFDLPGKTQHVRAYMNMDITML